MANSLPRFSKYTCLQEQTSARKIHVGVVGAGIGGLAAAIALKRAGARVTLLEAARELGEVCFIGHSLMKKFQLTRRV